MNTATCLQIYKLSYDELVLLGEHTRQNPNLKNNEDYLSALLKFDNLHRTLTNIIQSEVHETMTRVQTHIKIYKKETKGLFSIERIHENQ